MSTMNWQGCAARRTIYTSSQGITEQLDEYGIAFHEVGHYVAKATRRPNIPIKLAFVFDDNGNLEGGITDNANDEDGQDAPPDMILIAAAGAIAETYEEGKHSDRHKKEAINILEKVRGDFEKFVFAKGELKKEWQISDQYDYAALSPRECFYDRYNEVMGMFTDYGFPRMSDLARRLVSERELIMEPLGD